MVAGHGTGGAGPISNGTPADPGARRPAPSAPPNPWLAADAPRGDAYDERFARLAATGRNVHGEADLVERLGGRSVLDAGCGTGRVAVELAARGFEVVGVDLDPTMLATARRKAPELSWVQADLAGMDLGRTFDVVVAAGNVMIFLSPGTEAATLAALARHLTPGGRLVAGFSLGRRGVGLAAYDDLAGGAGLELAARWSTWDEAPYVEGGDYAVTMHRRPA